MAQANRAPGPLSRGFAAPVVDFHFALGRRRARENGEVPPAPTARSEILRLAVPAFLALVAEPLFLLVDSAIVGHLGVTELAGLGVASAVLATAASVFVFLAYGTTSVVARRLGAGQERATTCRRSRRA